MLIFSALEMLFYGRKDLLIQRMVCAQVRSASAVGNTITVTLTSCGAVYYAESCSYLRSAWLLACRYSNLIYVQLLLCLFPAIFCHSLSLSLSLETSVQNNAADGIVELEGIASTLIPQHFANANFSFWLQVKRLTWSQDCHVVFARICVYKNV